MNFLKIIHENEFCNVKLSNLENVLQITLRTDGAKAGADLG